MARMYGRAPRGQRVRANRPHDRGLVHTIVGALGLQGLVASMVFEGWLDTLAWRLFVRELLVPELQPGDVVVLDRLNVHKDSTARQLIEEAGATLVFLPRAAPDLNPIEFCWAKVKAHLRALAARTSDELVQGVVAALDAVTSDDCWGFFAGCGYL